MKKFLMVLLMLVIPIQVFAEDRTYIKGNVGIFMLEDSHGDFEPENMDNGLDFGKVQSKTGYGLGFAVGRSFGPLDMELAYGYNEVNLDKFKGKEFQLGGNVIPPENWEIAGEVNIKTLLFNSIYNLKNTSMFTPYVGVGTGLAWVGGSVQETPDQDAYNFEDTKFAYQIMAGVGAEVTRNVDFLVGYKYLGMSDISYHASDGLTGRGGKESLSIDAHSVDFGIKYSF
jgi:opacity protein-like surface antigen